MTEPKIVSIDITHLVIAALHGDADTRPPLTKPRDPHPGPPDGD
ncbi:hypothetical protein [Microbacterium sp.]|nr:hypothetical protein [Microbacterium sp.]